MMRTVVIQRAPNPDNPREWDNLGVMACWHSRHVLGDRLGREELASALADALNDIFAALYPEAARQGYSCSDADIPAGEGGGDKLVENPVHYDLGTKPREVMRALKIYDAHEDLVRPEHRFVYLPMHMFEHGDLIIRTSPFDGPDARWDSGQIGWIFALHSRALEDGVKEIQPGLADEDEIRKILEREVFLYNCYINGEVYGFSLYEHEPDQAPEDGKLILSCFNFYPDPDNPSDWKSTGIPDHLPDDWRSYRVVNEDGEVLHDDEPSADHAPELG